MGKEPMVKISFRITEKLLEYVDRGVNETGTDRSEVLRNIIADYQRFIKKINDY